MKKSLNIVLVLLLTLILSSCFTSQDDVNKAKQNIWIIEMNNTNEFIDTNDSWGNIGLKKEDIIDDIEEKIELIEEEKIEKIIIKSLTKEQFLEFDDLSNEDIFDKEVEIKWKTLWKVDKIIVTFVNNDSEFPVDTYTLKQFVSGWDTFLYRAFTKYETLDDWENIYVFEAFSWDISTKLQITINVIPEKEEVTIDPRVEEVEKNNTVYEEIELSDLPVNATFWTPVELWNGKISYTDLKWLEIKRDVNPTLTCENLTSVLADKVDSWFFWNTCRPIEGEEWVSYFVVRLDGDNYVYEKHYYLSYKWLYGIQELETGTWVDSKNIAEKNAELKLINDDFSILEVSDELFKEILK